MPMTQTPLFNDDANNTPNYQPRKTYHDNDAGHASQFVGWLAGRLIYVPENTVWYVWEGRSWREDNDGGVMRLREGDNRPQPWANPHKIVCDIVKAFARPGDMKECPLASRMVT